jgi:hypothetical protein
MCDSLANNRIDARLRREGRADEGGLQRKNLARIKARIHATQFCEAAQQEARAQQQDGGQENLAAHQESLKPPRRNAGAAAAGLS